MLKKKLKIGVLFGGKSAEYEVSVVSAENIIKALDKNKYQIYPIKINREGEFDLASLEKVDLVFPILHGPFGEDGSMQGLLKILGIPFVGPSVLGSALGMDKDVMKRLFRDAGIPIGKFITVHSNEKISFEKVRKVLGLPVFIKPANMGSSIGISKVNNKKEFEKAIKEAFLYDSKIVIEENISGQEIECSILGNENPMASTLGEVIPKNDFYSYKAKYVDQDGAVLLIPARLSKIITKKVQNIAIKVFKVLNCEGMGRVDFFVKKSGEIIVNEINTIPGFTPISMYPKLWEASGISTTKLLDRLIELSIERFETESRLKNIIK
ncbi:MAG: D-alanine-D-alanine ligase [Candidatus Nomurabacteria bacterium GW2011_GWE1_32_28]|uniref:D-alanine--D-alanine ligase n=1 Tax=Candidatus Nomurabacteria bacterium GW2011_GWF1_31_48 TaxID=1618767 RepID=A0A0G0AVQ7_9BACT|nr:MAG: D-alanine-D-alanine ligase [Candidatus Nomurabacteria bacterium GW2011_GWF2_30_133]KKP28967.1 MAG: D-alanine-D-alanine ligase [Candidatus Nomurabacteria bacterium GW2011_GWE2_31_40]KKP30705.1 MAG: D-alanine-D-alanine ligase [Candidatus Nomurabacteria bacterium GW2011_GWF1_31_48]KKP35223.1 MAG: D-alanine-D-alanine ligase [Candidatus Nomurabacteria bacterium GW2011_GWE1_32_28]HAS80530.1 D-alanine--D-alanine ligase A [Candidatus Nomurabacteria bacterium]